MLSSRSGARTAAWVLVAVAAPGTVRLAAAGPAPVVAGHARFEFLTPSLVRMEYSPSGRFVDAPTAVVEKRDWPTVQVHSQQQNGWLIASSSALTVRYRLDSGPFTATNLQASWSDRPGNSREWHPGEVDTLNLGGLTYSLDNVSQRNLVADKGDLQSPVEDLIPGIDVPLAPAKPGLLSRSGYAFIDDSRTPVWNSQRTWIQPRSEQDGEDWYLFTYDRDYPRVLEEYAQLCGRIPMIPRYVLGPSITDLNFEYFPGTAQSELPQLRNYGQRHVEQEVRRLREEHIPLDTLVLDFAWHNYGWQGGYDWSPLIPHPERLVTRLHALGIHLSLNDHPGYANTDESILSYSDSHAPEVLRALGRPLPPRPSFDLDISRQWRFAPDPHDEGLRNRWFAPDAAGPAWKPIRSGLPWQEQGYGGQKVGWYRASVRLPGKLPGALYVYLGEVSQSYRIFVNGAEAAHSQAHWPRRLTYTDITSSVKAGAANTIVLRVESGEEGGGILRGPVAIRDLTPPPRIYFDLSNQQQAEIFMRELHKPLMQVGVDLWWVDGGSGAVDMPGLNEQLWTNKVFYDYSQRESGKRAFILSRYGDWGSERYPGFFTGDTYSQWPVLGYEVAFTARGGNVLVPYITHDIGGFHGARIDFDLYARWIEFGAFSPLLRMHSAHENPREGNVRMPWVYGRRGIELMRKYFTLRNQLIPYLYTYSWLAHRESMPLVRPLYLQYPDLEPAYQHSREYFFGAQMLVAPVVDPSGTRTIYLPPGRWIDFFTGKHRDGGTTFTAHYAVDEIPVFVPDGALIPEQVTGDHSDTQPLETLILNVYGSGKGAFELYEDDGASLEYADGKYALTRITYAADGDGAHRLTIGPTKGKFHGQIEARSYEVRVHGITKPSRVVVGGRAFPGWTWSAPQATASLTIAKQSIRNPIEVVWR